MNKKKIYLLSAIALVISLAVEFLGLSHPHVYFPWHEIPGFDMVFGILGAVVLIVFAKFILAPIIQKSEDFYGGEEDDE